MKKPKLLLLYSALAVLFLALAAPSYAQLADVTQPGDPIVGSSANNPPSEAVGNAIDNQPTKYLNFDRLNTGFTVTPRVGLTVVQMLTLQSANDAPERDPIDFTLEGSYDGSNFTAIASGPVPAFTNRFHRVALAFSNNIPYLAYRLIFPNVGGGTCCMQIAEVELLGFLAPSDVTQPGDPIVGSSANNPPSEAVGNAIDNQPTKYLNFDRLNTGFTVTPSVGATLVKGITLTSANDAPERDPIDYTLEGSLDGTTFFPISSGPVPAFAARFQKNYIFFNNLRAYRAYRLIFPNVGGGTCCMQIAEVEFLGVVSDLPQDVTQPGDPIVGSSANNPPSEAVGNAIDNQPTKYLNFDRLNTGFTVSPRAGLTLVNGLTLTSANDAPERDPVDYTLEGSYDGSNFVAVSAGPVPAFTNRFHKVTVLFDNRIPYVHYRLIFPNVGGGTCCMQIAEVELLGTLAPTDVTVPGDQIVGSSANNPPSEAVGNAIDNQPTKYLNFDRLNTGFTVTPGVGDTIVTGLTLTSANDAPERDPIDYTLDASNDGVNYVRVSSGPVPPFVSRFQKNYIFFPDNTTAFKSYRLIFPNVGGGTCCMQIAEVEFLGVTPGVVNTNEVTTLVRRQPQDTPVLLGSRATFRVGLTGPWRVQWYSNNVAIAGASTATYTTLPVTAADDGVLYKAVISSPQGMQTTDEVMLNLFTPSTTESFGLSWVGGGANGAPTEMLRDDITGFHPQAYWNNLVGGGGTLTTVTNSNDQVPPAVSVTWATSGEWGSGTGEDDPTQRMLNGMATSFATTEAAAQTITFANVPAGTHSLLVYTVQVPLEFFNMDFRVVTHDAGGADVVQRRYIRPQNADEYNPSPGYVLVTAGTPETRSVGNMLRFDNIQPGPDGFIQIRFYSPGRVQAPGTEPIRGPGVNGLQLLLNPGAVPNPPVITGDPVGENAPRGGTVVLRAEATGNNLAYQWLKNGQAIAGETGPTLTLDNLQDSDAGRYTVAISNPGGRIVSRVAVVDVLQTDAVTEDLVVYFKFDEPGFDLGVADNSATNGVDGEVRGTAFDAGFGQVNGAIALNGTDNYVFVPNYVKPTDAMTAAGWIYANAEQAGSIINNWIQSNPTGSRGQFFVDVNSAGGTFNLRGAIGAGPNTLIAGNTLTNLGPEWHHFAVSANGSTLSTYWDGELLASTDYLGNINNPPFPWLSIGADFNGDTVNPAAGNFFNGALDDLAIWRRSLSGAEINAIYNAGLAGQAIDQVPSVSDPFLTIFRQGNDIVVSWSQNVLGYTLESSPSLSPASWTTVTGVANNRYTATGAASGTGMRFFRLVKQQ
jgi:hypothetical protein